MPIHIGTSDKNQQQIAIGLTQMQKVYVGDKLVWSKPTGITTIKFGALYNHYAAVDSRNICSVGFRLPTLTDKETTRIYIDPSGTSSINVAGKELKESGTIHWSGGNTGTNSFGFNGRGSGQRGLDGSFNLILDQGMSWTSTVVGSSARLMGLVVSSDSFTSGLAAFNYGWSIRLVRNATTEELSLPDGIISATYTGNDGKIYRCVKIGTLIWTADNLAETKFANGDWISGFDGGAYTAITNASWSSRGTAGESLMCIYNDNLGNV